MFRELEYVIFDRSSNKLCGVQAGLAFQVFQWLELPLRKLYLRNLLCHSGLFSVLASACWI